MDETKLCDDLETQVADSEAQEEQDQVPQEEDLDANWQQPYPETQDSEPVLNDDPYWKLAKDGLDLLLNNKRQEAENMFNNYPDSIQMYSGLATALFMDALMTFENDKLAIATVALKETDKKCNSSSFKGKTKLFGNDELCYAHQLEMQIIQADAQMYLASLTFLQQDIAAYFKGGWLLRKSWRRYQSTYNEILDLHTRIIGKSPLILSTPVLVQDRGTSSTSLGEDDLKRAVDVSTQSPSTTSNKGSLIKNGYIPKSNTLHQFPSTQHQHQHRHTRTTPDDSTHLIRNGGSTPTSTSPSSCSSLDPLVDGPGSISSNNSSTTNTLIKSASVNSALSKYTMFPKKLRKLAPLYFGSHLSFSSIANLNPFHTAAIKPVDIDKETIRRLMCGVSFGYGLMQLGMSLLPPSVVKLISIFGFSGNRNNGLSNLVYARTGQDMRSPLATLALLWYHTIVRPFFAIDGNNVQASVQAAAELIEQARETYGESSIFLYFRGRVERLNSNIPEAIVAFEACIEKTQQREIKVISLHELGWCFFIQLAHGKAYDTFSSLKKQSRWSRPFYSYIATIAAGSNGTLNRDGSYDDLLKIFSVSLPKGTQLDEFLVRRFKVCPSTRDKLCTTELVYWKLLVYELLYLWNTLPSCNTENINIIIEDCESVVDENKPEPFIGLSAFLAGCSYCIQKNYEFAIRSFRRCLEIRKPVQPSTDDLHVQAFTLYELGQLLLKNPETKAEGKEFLNQVHHFKCYDFEQRLSVRVNSILKSI